MGGRPIAQNHNPVIGGKGVKDPTQKLREAADAQRAAQREQERVSASSLARIAELEAEIAELKKEVDRLTVRTVSNLDDPIKNEDLELDKQPAIAKQKPASKIKADK
jgi:type II secretory pathway component PulJ